MHFLTRSAVLFALLLAQGLPTRIAHAQSATPQTRGASPSAGLSPVAEPADTSQQTVGWIVAGAGGVSLLGSGCMVLLLNEKRNDMRDAMGSDITAELQPYQTAATVLFFAGVAGIAVGLPLALIGGGDTRVEVSLERATVSGTF